MSATIDGLWAVAVCAAWAALLGAGVALQRPLTRLWRAAMAWLVGAAVRAGLID